MQFGTKIESRESKDSTQSWAKMSMMKSLEYSEFKEGQFSNENKSLKYRILRPEKLDLNKKKFGS